MGISKDSEENTTKQVQLKPLVTAMPVFTFLTLDHKQKSLNKTGPVHLNVPCPEGHDDIPESMNFDKVFDAATCKRLSSIIKTEMFAGRKGDLISLIISVDPYIKLSLIGVGEYSELLATAGNDGQAHSSPQNNVPGSDDVARQTWMQNAGAGFAKHLVRNVKEGKTSKYETAIILPGWWTPENQNRFIVGLATRLDTQLNYRTEPAKQAWPARITIYSEFSEDHNTKTALDLCVVEGCHLTRDLATLPGNILYPEVFCEHIMSLREHGIDVTILDKNDLAREGMGALLAVANGSARDPYVAIMQWRGGANGTATDVALVGKGVTFDSGGISLKPPGKMEDMKYDMCGAAVVCGEMLAIAKQKLACNITGIVGLVENMPDGKAQRPGDVVRAASGKTIEVINTDAEGRLVLADLLWYVETYIKPKAIIDLATLTGAIIVALGHSHAGLFSNNDALAQTLLEAARVSGERLWRLPLDAEYEQLIISEVADIKNTGGAPAGSITAAQFLKHFVLSTPWCHIDIAGMAWRATSGGIYPAGATGYGVLLLNTYLKGLTLAQNDHA